MPGLPLAEEVSRVVDRQLAVFKAGLVDECEKIALRHSEALESQKGKLEKQVAALLKLVQSPTVVDVDCIDVDCLSNEMGQMANCMVASISGMESEPTREDLVQSPPGKVSEVSQNGSTIGTMSKHNHLSKSVQIGDHQLEDTHWFDNAARPDHDGGKISIQGQESIQNEVQKSRFFILDPTGNVKLCWDVLGIPVLAWDLITIPMQVFGISEAPLMVTMGWITLIFWTMDIPICFITGFFNREGELILVWERIVFHYVRGMFPLDSMIILADWLAIILDLVASDGAPGLLSNIALLRALRITRFARLTRLRKLKAKWQTVEDHIDSEWALVCVNLFNKVMVILAVTHYVGCIFFFIGDQQIIGYDSWLDTPYFQYRSDSKTGCGATGADCTFADAPWGYQYWTVLHWALTQFTPGGMHVQPQNIPERAFTIFCLLFGMVVFSSFIANVTQARMQLNKMMSKFEKDMWLLRKFCRQNKISHQLSVRMRRYVDLVLIPKFHTMSTKDVILLPLLSEHLREELLTEMQLQLLACHPFFKELGKHKATMIKICTFVVTNVPVARGDVIFGAATAAKSMYIITSGCLDYIPHNSSHDQERLQKDRWILEACLWTKWTTQGQLQSDTESTCLAVDSQKLHLTLEEHAMYMAYAQRYASHFLNKLNDLWTREGDVPSDFQEDISVASHQAAIRAKSK